MNEKRFQKRTLFLFAYLLFAVLPIYWMINMSFKTNEEILSTFTFFPQHFTWANYKTIFTDESWYSGYINSLIYVSINMVITLTVALPAAYAFSRYSFLGDKHVFFWLLTNRMTPPAVFLLPFFQLYTTVGLMDTHIAVALAHLLFSVPLALTVRVMVATMGLAFTLVSVRASSSSTQLNMKQKNAATPTPALMSGRKMVRKKRGKL